jgi:hypothetical protein
LAGSRKLEIGRRGRDAHLVDRDHCRRCLRKGRRVDGCQQAVRSSNRSVRANGFGTVFRACAITSTHRVLRRPWTESRLTGRICWSPNPPDGTQSASSRQHSSPVLEIVQAPASFGAPPCVGDRIRRSGPRVTTGLERSLRGAVPFRREAARHESGILSRGAPALPATSAVADKRVAPRITAWPPAARPTARPGR